MTNVRIARQPILNEEQIVEGYELLYPTGEVDDTLAAARIALEALSEIGFERLVGTSRAWINVTPEFLAHDMVLNLPAERVVLELNPEIGQDPVVMARLRELRDEGYTLAAAHFQLAPDPQPLLGIVDIVKSDMREIGAWELARQSFELRNLDVSLVACNVETGDDFTRAKAAGANLFQGFFFCRPHMLPGRRITPSKAAMITIRTGESAA